MQQEDKIARLDIACRIANIGIDKKHLDAIVSLYDLIQEKEGKTTIDDVVTVKHNVDARYETRVKATTNQNSNPKVKKEKKQVFIYQVLKNSITDRRRLEHICSEIGESVFYDTIDSRMISYLFESNTITRAERILLRKSLKELSCK